MLLLHLSYLLQGDQCCNGAVRDQEGVAEAQKRRGLLKLQDGEGLVEVQMN